MCLVVPRMALEQKLDHMSRITRGIQLSCLFSLLSSETVPLSFMTLAFLEKYRSITFCVIEICSFMIRFKLPVLGRNITEVILCPS